MATLDQRRDALDPNISVRDTLTGGRGDSVFVGNQTRHVVGYMRDFLFAPEQAGTAVSRLSGGERGRLTLALALAKPSNLLVLDEPTNDLDLETLDLLEEMIDDYPGTVLLVSHDRDFLDRTVNAVIVADGGGRWNVYAGGYTDMVAQRGEGVTARTSRRKRKRRARERRSLHRARRSPVSPSRTSTRWKHCPRASPRSKPTSRSCRRPSRTRTFTRRIAPPSTRLRRRSPPRRPSSRGRRRVAAARGIEGAGGSEIVPAVIPGPPTGPCPESITIVVT